MIRHQNAKTVTYTPRVVITGSDVETLFTLVRGVLDEDSADLLSTYPVMSFARQIRDLDPMPAPVPVSYEPEFVEVNVTTTGTPRPDVDAEVEGTARSGLANSTRNQAAAGVLAGVHAPGPQSYNSFAPDLGRNYPASHSFWGVDY